MARRPSFDRLLTERSHPATAALDRMSAMEIARLMNEEDRRPVGAVQRALPAVARAVDVIAASLGAGGRLFFVGAGTSGRLGVIEAAECPPTFGTPPRLVQAIMAGGRGAVFRSREGAEDDARAGAHAVGARVRAGDVVVGITASGRTPFVRGALLRARRLGARTVLLACNRGGGRDQADVTIAVVPGPEVLAGSTRLKAGTATKLVLNTLTTGAMVRLGKVHGNRMVDLQPRSRKLRARAVRLVEEIAGVSPGQARRALAIARGRARLAIAMAGAGLGAREAAAALRKHGGDLRAVLAASAAGSERGRASR